ncbi:glycosyl transferase family 1 [Saccharospirillum sp. MSK14-1]|uniref:glycosyltransferase family 4 protein n=1 Tax=Saccharospirillum sp. MSK14-1 TaxID=1897632 RepID=UPI000D3501E1|nr:glycosyltransferase family 4 protein [Saccharospirillum sp. MSK14-1]PTY38865.1 glycosyl transferase family 1 [Saccharospirillum sp. MSK14-1]
MGPSIDPQFELILGNSNKRFSGVTSTLLQVLQVQKQRCSLVVLGDHHLPDDVPSLGFWQLLKLARKPLANGRVRVFHARRNDEMIQALLLKWLGARIRIVFTSTAQRRKTWLTRFLMRHMDGLLSTCTAAARYMPTPPDQLIPHGINIEHYAPADDRRALWESLSLPGQFGIGIFGRVREQKGVDLLVQAALKVLPDHPAFSVVIVGGYGSDQQAFVEQQKRLIEAAGLSERIVFTGELPFAQVPDYFRAMSIVTALSRNEGFGLTVLEAMSTEAAVVASEAGAWPDIIDDGRNGYLVPAGDWYQVAERLEMLVTDAQLRAQIAAAGRQTVLANYTVEREANALLDYYSQIAAADH